MVRYYEQIAPVMLPYAARRLLSIVRCPKGAATACFYKKHPGPGSSGVVAVSVPSSDGDPEEYFYLEDVAGLVSEAQMDALEFHLWGSHVDTLEQPDLMVFDLDPDEGMDLGRVRQGMRRDVKSVLGRAVADVVPEDQRRQGLSRGRAVLAIRHLGRLP